MRVEGMGAKGGFKKGQLSPGVLITLIIIALVLIVGLIVYVVVSDKGEGGETTTLPSGVVVGTPDPIAEQCRLACESGSKIGFCDVERKVTDALSTSCKELSTNSQYSSYNVQICTSIDCNSAPATQTDTTCSGLSGTWTTPTSDGKCPQSGNRLKRQITPSDNPPSAGQICCR